FNAEDVERYLVYGTALDNQRAASARGTFLQNWGYLDSLHRAGNNLVEMEAGPYLEAFTELMLPERAPHGEMVNLVGAPVDLGFVHTRRIRRTAKGRRWASATSATSAWIRLMPRHWQLPDA